MEPNELIEEPTAVDGAEAGEAPPELAEGAEVQQEPAGEPEPKPAETRIDRPGKISQAEQQLNWYKQNYAQAMEALQGYQARIDEIELAGLDEDEREKAQLQREMERLQGQMEEVRMEKATEQWRGYYQQFAPKDADLSATNNPIEMQHATLVSLFNERDELAKQVKALERAVQKQKPGKPVSSGAASPPPSSGLWSLDQTPEQMEETFRRAKLGLI